MAKQDVISRKEIEIIVNAFYEKVIVDEKIGFMFASVNWEAHLPVMYKFWDNVLFHTGNYSGNPMEKHQRAHSINPMKTEYFKRWLELFESTIDQLFEGKNANYLKERARSIAIIMQIKIIGNGMDL